MESNWIKISRDICDHWLWQDAERLKWWLDLLLAAAWKERKQISGGKVITLRRGQMTVSIRLLQDRWAKRNEDGKIIEKPGLHRVLNFLRLLEEDGMITRDMRQHQNTILTICNYERYQANDTASGNTLGNTLGNTQNGTFDTKRGILRNQSKRVLTDCNSDNSESEISTSETNGDTASGNTLGNTLGNTNQEKESFPPHPPYKEKEKEKETSSSLGNAHAREEKKLVMLGELLQGMKSSPIWLDQVAKKFRLPREQLMNLIDEFKEHCFCYDKQLENITEAKRYFVNWLFKTFEQQRKQAAAPKSRDQKRKDLMEAAARRMTQAIENDKLNNPL